MDGFLLVLAFAALPALGNVLGALASEITEISERTLSLALHLAAGVVLAVVGLELLPEAMTSSAPWIPIAAFAVGGLLFIAIEKAIGIVKHRYVGSDGSSGPLAIYTGVSLDLFSDGVMIGTATLIDPSLGFLLALGQVPADIPEGFAALASLRRAGVRRSTRLKMGAAFAAPVIVGAALGYFALREAPEIITLSVLALTGGVLISVVVEEIVHEAHEGETSRFGPFALTAGFALFALLSAYLVV